MLLRWNTNSLNTNSDSEFVRVGDVPGCRHGLPRAKGGRELLIPCGVQGFSLVAFRRRALGSLSGWNLSVGRSDRSRSRPRDAPSWRTAGAGRGGGGGGGEAGGRGREGAVIEIFLVGREPPPGGCRLLGIPKGLFRLLDDVCKWLSRGLENSCTTAM